MIAPAVVVTVYNDLRGVRALPSLDDLDTTRHGYALDASHADLTRDLLEQAATAVQSGLVSTDVGLEVLAWMRAHHPAAIMGRVQP